VKVLNERLDRNNELVRFIELVCKGTLKIRNRSKKDIAQDMKSYKLPIDLINTAMSKCTQEERDELLKQNKELREQLKYIQATTTTQMYLNDLKELRKTLDKEF
jgi:GTP-binding protein EngB required for normal cell division